MEKPNNILIGNRGAAGFITLNRPEARNAIDTAMRAGIADALPIWVRDPNTYALLIASAGDGAFCAGGDVIETVTWGRTRRQEAYASIAAEYALVWRLECFTKPIVSLIDGIVVGAGVGITLYGTHRVAGERYRFAMPEVGIGLFPDDGVCHAFARMPNQIGMYLALTGRSIGRADAFRLGLVTHCIEASAFGSIRSAIADAEPVDQVLDSRHVDPGPGELEAVEEFIGECFSGDTVEEIVGRLDAEKGTLEAWARTVAHELGQRCPTSLKVTHRHVRAAQALDLRATLVQDYRIARRCLERGDFYEGVRALLIDKDRTPRWEPERLQGVSEAAVEAHFALPAGGEDLALATRSEMQALQP